MTLEAAPQPAATMRHGRSKLRWIVAFPFPCPHCGKEHMKIVAQVEHDPTFICDGDNGCGAQIQTSTGELAVYKAEVLKALDGIGPLYKRMGSTPNAAER